MPFAVWSFFTFPLRRGEHKMLHRYKPDDYETKLIILYSIKKLNKSPSYSLLSQVITAAADINYFEIEGYMSELSELGSTREYLIEGEPVFSLTPSGMEMCEYFETRIPASVREKIELSAAEINNDKSDRNKVYANYIPISEMEYKVHCGILEDNVKLLDFEMYAGPKERAKDICEYFKEHTKDFYVAIIEHIEKNSKKD